MKKNSTIIFLVLAGLGVWWYMKKKSTKTTKTIQDLPEHGGPGGGPGNIEAEYIRPDRDFAPDMSNVLKSNPIPDVNLTFSINGFRKKLGNVPNTI